MPKEELPYAPTPAAMIRLLKKTTSSASRATTARTKSSSTQKRKPQSSSHCTQKSYPAPSDPAALHPEGRQFLMVVPFDQLAYDKKYNAKAVKKTLSIPAWLNNLAKANNINFSSVLQNALCRELHIQST